MEVGICAVGPLPSARAIATWNPRLKATTNTKEHNTAFALTVFVTIARLHTMHLTSNYHGSKQGHWNL
jgi:hypothetical protein